MLCPFYPCSPFHYPHPFRCRYETGGILKDLRELTNDRVRAYHASYYRPENLCIIITGLFAGKERDIFSVISSVEDEILKMSKKPPVLVYIFVFVYSASERMIV